MAVLLAMLAALFGATACRCVWLDGKTVEGSGEVISRSVAIGDFDRVEASRAVKVVVAERTGDAEVRTDDNLQRYVSVETCDGKLKVGIADGVYPKPSEQIVVYIPDNGRIRKLEASSAAKILVDKQIVGESLEIDASGAAKVRVTAEVGTCDMEASGGACIAARIVAGRLNVAASSAAVVTLRGEVEEAVFDAGSAASVRAGGLTAGLCEARASGAAKIRVRCERSLRTRTSSAGSVRYFGTCRTYLTDTTGGSSCRSEECPENDKRES